MLLRALFQAWLGRRTCQPPLQRSGGALISRFPSACRAWLTAYAGVRKLGAVTRPLGRHCTAAWGPTTRRVASAMVHAERPRR